MNILVIGSGGREHALAWKLGMSKSVDKVFCLPGNGGTASKAINLNIKGADLKEQVLMAVEEYSIDLVVVGPEQPLADGLVNLLEAEGISAFGPCAEAAKIESSKTFAKEIMESEGVPTASYRSFSELAGAISFLDEIDPPYVIKADGLAAGKGVSVCSSLVEAKDVLSALFVDGKLGNAARKVIIEEYLKGVELSYFVITDGRRVVPFGTAHDYKQVYDGNRGPNTGGMGAFSPSPLLNNDLHQTIITKIIQPTLRGLRKKGTVYKGFLYAGLILTEQGPKVLEFNCRLGDPEAQVLLPRLQSDLAGIMRDTLEGRLSEDIVEFSEQTCLAVILASGGYPGRYKKGEVITIDDRLTEMKDMYLFHAGTKIVEDNKRKLVTAGGRVLAVSALGESTKEAAAKAYRGVAMINFPGMIYRRDIGKLYGKDDGRE